MARTPCPADTLQIIAPVASKHYEAILDLTAKAFARRRYWGWLDYCNNGYIAHSPYHWEASRIGLVDGELATHFGIWDHWMRIGTATVRVAGVGAVATHGAYYRQGLMARTAAACVEDLASYGYHMTMLHGIPDFYHRFGYVRAWHDTTYSAELADLPAAGRRPRLRAVGRDWAGLDALHNRQNAGLTGTAVRPTYRRNRRPEWKAWQWGDGRTEGYVVVWGQDDALELVDQAGDAERVLEAVSWLTREAGYRRVRFPSLHYRSDLCRRLRAGNCRVEQRIHACGGWMVRTVSLAGSLARMAGEMGRRLRSSGLAGWRGELLIEDPRERVVLAVDGGRVAVGAAQGRAPRSTVRGGEQIAQLLLGTDEPEELALAAGIRLSGDARMLVKAIFPAQQPSIPFWDHY